MAENPNQIEGEIERTRVEMSETLGEIQDRLRPDHLLQQARDGVTEAAAGKVRTMMSSARDTASTVATRARDTGTYLADYATAHPIRIAITVGALTWWMLRGRGQSPSWYGAADTDWDESEDPAYRDPSTSLRAGPATSFGAASRPLRDTVGEYASSARQTVNEYASSARDTVGEYAVSARQQAQRASTRVRSAASAAAATTDEWVHEYPMAAGAVALAVGAAIGLSVRRTEWEDCAMGETRDRAWEQASRAAANLKDTVTQKVTTAAENLVGESISKAAQTPSDLTGRA